MAEIKISELPESTDIDNDADYVIVQNMTTKKINYLNINKYHTTEEKIGTWVDGENIYRQVIIGDSTTPLSNDMTLVSGVGTCIRCYGEVTPPNVSNSKYINIPTNGDSTYYLYVNTYSEMVSDVKTLKLTISGAFSSLLGYIVIEYTKANE